MSAVTDLDVIAAGYAARGWPVFPVNPATNRPLLRSAHPDGDPLRGKCVGGCGRHGHGFHDATTNQEQVLRWWTHTPHASIGVRTGVAFDVLDIDDDDFEAAVRDLPDCEVIGPSARSGGGGWHLYTLPTGFGRRIRFSSMCDWLGTDGYVIAPPSKHKSGGTYSWITSPQEVDLRPAPVELIESVGRGRTEPRQRDRPRVSQRRSPIRTSVKSGTGWSASGLVDAVANAAEGERNGKLNWAAHRLGLDLREGRATRVDATDALAALESVAGDVGLDVREIADTITSGFRGGSGGAR